MALESPEFMCHPRLCRACHVVLCWASFSQATWWSCEARLP
jgi:hypothetical protein